MYFNLHTGTSRDIFSFNDSKNSPFIQILSNLLSALIPRNLLSLVPAIICGCSGVSVIEDPVSVNNLSFSKVMTDWVSEDTPLDIFAFEKDKFKRLDSYQRIDGFSGTNAAIASTGRNKIFFLCMNSQHEKYSWADIQSYSSLKNVFVELEMEESQAIACSGEIVDIAGNTTSDIRLQPLASEVVLRTIRCDFVGTPYSGEEIRDVKVYLTNVSATCPIVYDESFRPIRFINCGMLNMADLRDFKSPEVIVRDIVDPITDDISHLDISLLCYPNRFIKDNLGSPQTRLVIEGTVESMTYYWPITINPEVGIDRGCRYVFDLLIRRKGCTDPDIAFDPLSIEIDMKINPWIEKENYPVGF